MPRITIIDNLDGVASLAHGIVCQLLDDAGKKGCDLYLEDVYSHWYDIVRYAIERHLLSPEDLAMLQALYSRSPRSVAKHLQKVRATGAGTFMSQYLVGYGHASIGDCGTTAIFIEDVSMLAAKAIQDWPLYSGQEASTRYMDFSTARFDNPLGTPEGEAIQEAWRTFYLEAQDPLLEHLRTTYPRHNGEDEKVYERAIAARGFDTLRGFLPAGASTNLSWTTNLRQANDHLRWLFHHPSAEVRFLAADLFDALRARYPHSFGEHSLKEAREGGAASEVAAWTERIMREDYLWDPERKAVGELWCMATPPASILGLLCDRPRGAELPPHLTECGLIRSSFLLDFGSFRDLQRHRNGTIRMPLLAPTWDFHRWYLNQLPSALLRTAKELLGHQMDRIRALHGVSSASHDGWREPRTGDRFAIQSYIAMGYRVPVRVTQGFPGFIYRLELRSSKTVHPTLRYEVLREARWFRAAFPEIPIYIDDDPDDWTLRRGIQTIEER